MKPPRNAMFTKGFSANELLHSCTTQKCGSSQVVDKNWVYCQPRVDDKSGQSLVQSLWYSSFWRRQKRLSVSDVRVWVYSYFLEAVRTCVDLISFRLTKILVENVLLFISGQHFKAFVSIKCWKGICCVHWNAICASSMTLRLTMLVCWRL